MADTSVPNLTELTSPATGDLLHIVDVSASADPKDRKITIANLEASFFDTPITIGSNGSTEGGATFAALGSADWHIALDQATWFGNPNDLFFLGYNRTGISTFDDTDLHSLAMIIEADYYSDASTHFAEWYVEYRAADGTTRRPFQSSINLDTDVVHNIITGRIDVYDSDGTQTIIIDAPEGGLTVTGAITMTTNGIGFIRQRNAADTSDLDLMFLNSADQVSIGPAVTMWSDILFNHSSSNGVILMDRVGGAQYRLKVESGVLGIEAV